MRRLIFTTLLTVIATTRMLAASPPTRISAAAGDQSLLATQNTLCGQTEMNYNADSICRTGTNGGQLCSYDAYGRTCAWFEAIYYDRSGHEISSTFTCETCSNSKGPLSSGPGYKDPADGCTGDLLGCPAQCSSCSR
jgi:hypothetical protein